jgi:FlaA1/EpsC-like NDP-sugar epimerase
LIPPHNQGLILFLVAFLCQTVEGAMVKRIGRAAHSLVRERVWVSGVLQCAIVCLSFLAGWFLHFGIVPIGNSFLWPCLLLVAIRLAFIRTFNLLHGWWTFTGISDGLEVAKSVVLGSVCFFALTHYVLPAQRLPFALHFMEMIITGVSLGTIRVASRIMAEAIRRLPEIGQRTLIVGAGFAGQAVLRELRQSGDCEVVGFVDDDESKRGLKLHGVKILGSIDHLPEIASRNQVQEILIAIPSASGRQLRRIVNICQNTGIQFRTIPGLHELIAGVSSVQQLRQVRTEDLLGRKPVSLDSANVQQELLGKVVLVTGAAGSIGSELCRQILKFKPKILVCVDHDETATFFLDQELSSTPNGLRAAYVVSDIGNQASMHRVFCEYQPEIVFHAAAYKHVPLMEVNVAEAVHNNIFGLLKLLEVAETHGCRKLVMISSDKAVNPTNVMGCTKRVCELILAARVGTMACVSVRFGNVLGSNGSVIQVFEKQLQERVPLTITHPSITRYFMTINEAVSLVLQASTVGQSREILVLDMGEPMSILELAHSVIRLAGKSPKEVQIKYTGLRQGEKLYEELFYDFEEIVSSVCPKVRRTRSSLQSWADLQIQLENLRLALNSGSATPIRECLTQIVPQYSFSRDNSTAGDANKALVREKSSSAVAGMSIN